MRNIVVFIIFSFFFIFPIKAYAVEEFTTSVIVTYDIPVQGTPVVKNEIHIKNNFSSMYSTQFALEIGSTSLRSIRAYDQLGKDIPITATQTEKRTSMALSFPDKILGKDKERVFTIEYEQPDAVMMTGRVLEVDVPRLAQPEMFQQYVVRIQVPQQYGTPAATAPSSYTAEPTEHGQIFTFTTHAAEGINMLFGESQHYAFTMKYTLNNPSISQGISQIALPPDTAFQRVVYTNIEPRPDTINRDDDGNWIATYTVEAQKKLVVTATGIATVYLRPSVSIDSTTDPKHYLGEQPFWETRNGKVQELAKQLKTPQEIYDYLVRTYSYDYARLTALDQRRRGAATALESPLNTLCQEFTDSFIAIARAAGIPARELNGFAYTENPKLRPLSLVGDLLHAWPEYYDPSRKVWIPVDPTWGNTTNGVDFFTKLDFNHIVFVIHGSSSEKPYSAGMYKVDGTEGRDVEVQLTSLDHDPVQELVLHPPTFLQPNVIIVENPVGAAWYDVPVKITLSPELAFAGKRVHELSILPYQRKEIAIPVESSSLLSFAQRSGKVTVTIGDETITYETTVGTVKPAIALGIGFGLSTIIAGCVLVFRRKR